jgi:nucleotide-binding universal stress UspA family protein
MKRVLVPLDKSDAAEAVFPLIAMLAKAGATVRLVHVAAVAENVLGDDGRVAVFADQEMQSREAEWTDYVVAAQARLGVKLEGAIRFGDPATEILQEAEVCGADTVVVTASTSGSVRRALFGSVADTMLRRAPLDVLMWRPAAAA